MSAAAPWSVKGIDPKAREIAKDLARRSGLTLGEWLNSMIMEDETEDDDYAVMPRRAAASAFERTFDRRARQRRLDDAYDAPGDDLRRVSASIEAIAARLEASERRAQAAIQGVDQAVAGLMRRLDGQDQETRAWTRRVDDIADDLKEGHRRLRQFEQEVGPRTTETFGQVETSLKALASRLYEMEERQRAGVQELRQRLDAAEKAPADPAPDLAPAILAQVGARLDSAQSRTSEALRALERSFADIDRRLRVAEARPALDREGARFEKLAETLARQVDSNRAEMMRRLDGAEAGARLDRIERAAQAIGEQAKAAERRSARDIEAMGREVLRIAENLNGRMKRVEAEGPAQIEAQVGAQIGAQVQARVDTLGQALTRKVERDMGRLGGVVEQRLVAADDRHALAVEKLGEAITRISDRLGDRIAQSERRAAQAMDDIDRRLSDSAARMEQHYDRASGELAERMRLSEARTAQLLAEARDSIERRAGATRPAPASAPILDPTPLDEADFVQPPLPRPEATAEAGSPRPDWRAAAFPDDAFDAPADFPAFDDPAPAAPEPVRTPEFAAQRPTEPRPFGARPEAPQVAVEAPLHAEPEPAPPEPVRPEPAFSPFSGSSDADAFGGADVRDALEATAGALDDGFQPGQDPFAAETEFVDSRSLRAASANTRGALDAARAAMAASEETAARPGFGLKLNRGGKSRLQERLDKQAGRGGGTVRKAVLASVTAVALTGGLYGYARLTGAGSLSLDGLPLESLPLGGLMGGQPGGSAGRVSALTATTAAPAASDAPASSDEGADLYAEAMGQIATGDAAGVETLRRSANLGHAPAQLQLAGLYQNGEMGLDADAAESRLWARRAAEGGDARGMHAYGMYLFDGVGGGRNRPAALDWLKKAAEAGLIDSQFNVARLYENGDEGIAPNRDEALKWYMIAARAGDQQAQAAVQRLTPGARPGALQAARRAADAFQAEAAG